MGFSVACFSTWVCRTIHQARVSRLFFRFLWPLPIEAELFNTSRDTLCGKFHLFKNAISSDIWTNFVVDGSMIILYLNVTLSLNQIFDYVVRLPQAASYKNTMFLLQLLLQESLLQPLHFCKKLNKSKLKTLSTDTLSKFNFSSSYWKVHCRKSNDSKSTSSDNSLFPH